MPINVKKALHKAKTLARRGGVDAAARLYREILADYPQNRQAINGLASLNRGGRVLRTSAPAPSRDQMSQLLALYQTGRLDQALAQGKRLAQQFPQDPVIHNFLGVIELGLGNAGPALQHCEKAVSLASDYGEALCNRGVALQRLGKLREAANSYARAVEAQPEDGNAHYGLGTAQRELGLQRQAAASFQRVIELQPDNAAAYNNLGNALQYLGRLDVALRARTKAVKLDPDSADAHYNLGHTLFELERYPQAIASYSAALSLLELDDARAKIMDARARICDWSQRRIDDQRLSTLGLGDELVSPFGLLAIDADPHRQKLRAECYARHKFGNHREMTPPTRPSSRPDKLRIAYFSSDFHNHATMYLMIKMFELHDRERFAIHAYSYGPDQDDEMGRRLKGGVDVFHDVRDMGERAVAELAQSEHIDIAVDLKGYTQHGRMGIFAHRAAPIQISYLGYPGTLGLPTMDYLLADSTVVPDADQTHFTEEVIYLPHSYQVNDRDREIALQCPTRLEAGLPEDGFVFCCFNNTYKISPVEFDIWMRLLVGVEDSVLWLIATNEHVERNLRSEARERGVDPDRIIFAGRLPLPEHLARHQLADLFLDTFNVNAHTTASDALWAGLPMVTRLGRSFASRVGGSLLKAVGLPELITESDEQYESLALALARDPAHLSAIREKLRVNRLKSPLFDSAGFTRDIENAYEEAYARYLEGRQPETFAVTSAGNVP